MKYTEEYQQAFSQIKSMDMGLSDQEIERIINNLSTPTSVDMEKSIEEAIKKIKSV
jgi:uncharacterized protein YqgV (UPF0045/DUF77 family)